MYNSLKKLISLHFYPNKETATKKVSICFAMDTITETQYVELTMLIDEVYA